MELSKIGEEYLACHERLLEKIHILTKELKTAKGNDLIFLKRRILSLYCDAAECKRTGRHLINYCKKENEK